MERDCCAYGVERGIKGNKKGGEVRKALGLTDPATSIKTRVYTVKILNKAPIIKFSVTKLCQIFRVKRDTYYKYFKPKSRKRILENMEKERAIMVVFEENRRVYGVEKLKKAMDRTGLQISRRKIREIQGRLGLFPAYIRRFKQRYKSGRIRGG